MSRRLPVLLAAGGSAALLMAALGFQYLGGLAPCELCLWQRWPHVAAVAVGLVALARPGRAWPALGALAALATAALGLYHTGVERGWWAGPATCTGTGARLGDMSGDALLSTAKVPDVVMCDQVAWQFLGLSMASWNALLSLVLAALWVRAATRARCVARI